MGSRSPSESSELILVLAPRGRDAELASELIRRHGFTAEVCSSVDELVRRIPEIGAAVITAETLTETAREALNHGLAKQPPWSDLPIILFAPRGLDRADEAMVAERVLGNVTILERPVHATTMISSAVAALRARRRQYEAREAILRRDQFLAMLGHELRNPLAAIALAVESLPPSDGKSPGDKQRAIIERQARHLGRLVDDLLDVARVTSGKVRLQIEPLDLGQVIERCLQGAELAADARRIELRAELPPGPLVVDGDPTRLEEVFNNLIANGIKYSHEGGRVIVRAARRGDAIAVEVADTGIGIAPEMVERVFDLFSQADATLDRSQGGLGIGLTLARSLVELHGGTIHARSSGLGRGSTFALELPASRSAPRSVAPQLSVVQPSARLHVLLIEDNVDLLEMTRDLLEANGSVVATASDGAAGLSLLLQQRPDVAFIDIGLPGLDGYEIARSARAAGVTSDLVAMTGYGQPDDQARALAAGFDRHLTKPVKVAALREVLDSRAARTPAGRATRRS